MDEKMALKFLQVCLIPLPFYNVPSICIFIYYSSPFFYRVTYRQLSVLPELPGLGLLLPEVRRTWIMFGSVTLN